MEYCLVLYKRKMICYNIKYVVLPFSDLPLSEWTGNHINRKGKMSVNRGLLNRRLLEVFSKIARQLCYVVLVLIICTHNDVEKSYLQNENIRNQLSPISKVNNTLDIWNYLSHQFIHKIFPKRLSGADVRLVYDRGFMDDDCSYKIGLIQLRQMRVNGKCTVPKIMSKTVDFCYMSYDTKDARETMHFCPEWKPYTEACFSDGFKFYDDFATGSACFVGRFATYDGGGYLKVLDPTKSEIQNDILKLKTNNWINDKTRLVVAEGVVLNINTKLFTSFRIMFELPPWGNVEASLEVKTTQLYPYISTSDFLVLGLQILFILMTFFRVLFLIFAIFKDNNRSRHMTGHLVELMSVGLCITAIVCYIIRIDNTISSIEAIYNTKEVFVSFEDVNKFDTLYRIIMSTEMFIAIVRLLQPLNLNFHLFVMQNAISSHKNEILSFGIMVCILMTSFAAFMYLYGDWTLYKFRSVLASYLTLLQAFLSMVRFKEAFHTTDLVLESMFTFFLFCSSVLIINMFISMLNDGFKTVKHSNHTNGVTKFDKELNEHFWWKMENFQKIFSSMNETKTERKRKYITDSRQ
ncbi:polycystin-2-like [Mytilus edulis]|uniref:polycystin-2-like n=1 Tax=Mytilus edulis TaxID=6550 RepID=UPI0039F0AAE8